MGKAGLFWTFFQPFMQVALFVILRGFILGGGSENYDVATFMASGFIAFNMFRDTLSGSTNAFIANKQLFIYKQVKPIDTILARLLKTMFITSIIVLMFLFIGFFFQYGNIAPQNILMVFLGYLWLIVFSISVSLVAAIGSAFYISIGRVIGIMSFALLLGSAVFFPIISVPAEYQEYFLYNPLVHFMEMIHAAYIPELDDRFVDYQFMMYWTVVPMFIGAWLYQKLEKRIISL